MDGERVTSNIHVIIKVLLCWGCSLMGIHNEPKYYTASIQKGYLYIYSPYFQLCSFQDHNELVERLATAMN